MRVVVLVEKKNDSVTARTLHTLIHMSRVTRTNGMSLTIEYYVDGTIKNFIKNHDRVVWLGYGVHIGVPGIMNLLKPYAPGIGAVVLSSSDGTIDWDLFKTKTLRGSTEPPEQRGLCFDTELSHKIDENIYIVKKTSARAWSFDSKMFMKKMKSKKKGEGLVVPSVSTIITKMMESGIKVCTDVTVSTNIVYPHECFGNILESAGINK